MWLVQWSNLVGAYLAVLPAFSGVTGMTCLRRSYRRSPEVGNWHCTHDRAGDYRAVDSQVGLCSSTSVKGAGFHSWQDIGLLPHWLIVSMITRLYDLVRA